MSIQPDFNSIQPGVGGIPLECFSPNCPCCDGQNREEVSHPLSHHAKITGRFQYVRCLGCGLTYQCPRPTNPELGRCYVVLQVSAVAPTAAPLNYKGLKAWLQGRWSRMSGENAALPYINKGPILDVGCNRGELMLQLRAAGYEVEGIEYDKATTEVCRGLGFQVYQGDVASVELPAKRYGCIILSHTLEHLTDPVADLRKLSISLADATSGIIIVVPHVNSPVRRWFGDSWHGWDPPFHICHFTTETLGKVAAQAGLKMVRYRKILTAEDVTRSRSLASGKRRRSLFLRLLLTPALKFLQLFGFGSVLVAELRLAPASE